VPLKFSLHTNFPTRVLTEMAGDLKTLGLTNAMIMVQEVEDEEDSTGAE